MGKEEAEEDWSEDDPCFDLSIAAESFAYDSGPSRELNKRNNRAVRVNSTHLTPSDMWVGKTPRL